MFPGTFYAVSCAKCQNTVRETSMYVLRNIILVFPVLTWYSWKGFTRAVVNRQVLRALVAPGDSQSKARSHDLCCSGFSNTCRHSTLIVFYRTNCHSYEEISIYNFFFTATFCYWVTVTEHGYVKRIKVVFLIQYRPQFCLQISKH